MKRFLLHFIVLTAVLLTSCHSSQKYVSSRSRQPRFIDDIYIDGHNRTNATADAIDRNVKTPTKKYTNKKYTVARKPANEQDPAKTVAGKTNNTIPIPYVNKGQSAQLAEKYASMLGVTKKDIDNYNLYNFIEEWYGTDYHLGGQDKTGIDCSGFAKKLYEIVFGTELSHSSSEQYSTCKHIKKGTEPEQGDLVFFKTRGRHISHVGVYLMNNFFVHASTSNGVMISSLNEEYWHKHYVGAGKVL